MNETQQLLDKAVLSTVRAIILRDMDKPIPRPTDHELTTLRTIAGSNAASPGTRLSAVRALTWLAGEVLSEMRRPQQEIDSTCSRNLALP